MSNSTLRGLGRPHCLNYGRIPVGGLPAICRVPAYEMKDFSCSQYPNVNNFIR